MARSTGVVGSLEHAFRIDENVSFCVCIYIYRYTYIVRVIYCTRILLYAPMHMTAVVKIQQIWVCGAQGVLRGDCQNSPQERSLFMYDTS